MENEYSAVWQRYFWRMVVKRDIFKLICSTFAPRIVCGIIDKAVLLIAD